jgi:hypothetical protein
MMKESAMYQQMMILLEKQLNSLKSFFGTDYTKLDFTLSSKEHIGFIINAMGQSYRLPVVSTKTNPEALSGLNRSTPEYTGSLIDPVKGNSITPDMCTTRSTGVETDTPAPGSSISVKTDIFISFDPPKVDTYVVKQHLNNHNEMVNDDYGYDDEKDETFHEYLNEKLQAVDYECTGQIAGDLFWYVYTYT